jgi:hypothetical protein
VPKLIVTVIQLETLPFTEGIYILDLDAQGNPIAPGTKIAGFSTGGLRLFQHATLSPSGDQILVKDPRTHTDFDIYLLDGIAEILAGTQPPILSFSDPRIHAVETGPRVSSWPNWSQDGTLIYFSDDANGAFDETDQLGTIDLSDFDPMVTTLADVLAGSPSTQRVVSPGQQFGFSSPPGGTRFAYAEFDSGQLSGQLIVATWRISDEIDLGISGVAQSDFTLADGSGTNLFVAAGTAVGNVGTGIQSLSVFTPFTPVEEVQLSVGVSAVPVLRDFGPDGATFSPPAEVTISYTDAEVAGLDESKLRIYELNDVTGNFDIELPIVGRDLAGNTITFQAASFSVFGIGGGPATALPGAPPLLAALALIAATLAASLGRRGATRPSA